MPDNLAANVDLQDLLLSARGGVLSSIMPHVVSKQLRRYMQSYNLPSVTSGDEGLELTYWCGIPLDNDDSGDFVQLSNFPVGFNGKYIATKRKSCREPIYQKEGGSLMLVHSNERRETGPNCRGNRYHVQGTNNKVYYYLSGTLPVGKINSDPNEMWYEQQLHLQPYVNGKPWEKVPQCKSLLYQTITSVTFGQTVKAPANFKWNGSLAVHNGSFDMYKGDEGWIVFDVYHLQGGQHDVYMTYTADDSRPCTLRVNGDQIYSGIAAQTTGGWGDGTIKTMKVPDCRVNLGPAKTSTKVEIKAEGTYMPHLCKMRFDPIDGRRDVEGMPQPQAYTGDRISRGQHKGSLIEDGEFLEGRPVSDLEAITFRNRLYGGEANTCRMSIFSTKGLESLLTSESVIPATAECVGGRYKNAAIWGDPIEKLPPKTSSKWRLTAANGTGSKFWNVTTLQFLNKQGQPVPQERARALSCGSMIASLGPENALGCLPELHRTDVDANRPILPEQKVEVGNNNTAVITMEEWEGGTLDTLPDGKKVLSAWYGTDSNNGAWLDVDLVRSGMRIDNGMGAGDPVHGQRKKLVVTLGSSEEDVAWVGTLSDSSAESFGTGKIKEHGSALYIGLDFNQEIEIGGFEILQGHNYGSMSLQELQRLNEIQGEDEEKYRKLSRFGTSDFASRVSLECLDTRSGSPVWRTIQTFTMRESKFGRKVTRKLGQTAGGKSIPSDQNNVFGVLGALSKTGDQWIAEILMRILTDLVSQSYEGDNIILLFPHTHNYDSTTILMCDPSKPSSMRWSLMMLDRCHHCINVFALREHGRRCVTEHIWTSNFLLSKHEILPNNMMPDLWQPHPWTKHSAGYVFDDVSVGGWTLGLDMKPSLCVGRKVNGNPEVLIPARYLGGILPDCLTDNFRFWRDESLHTVVAERTLEADGKKYFSSRCFVAQTLEGPSSFFFFQFFNRNMVWV